MWTQKAPKSLYETSVYGSLRDVYIPFGINTVFSGRKRSVQNGVGRLMMFRPSICHGTTSLMKHSSGSQIQRKIKYNRRNSAKYMSNPVASLFEHAKFETSKLNVIFLAVDEEKHLPRTYTLTHSDITAQLTLTVSPTINKAQLEGWYNRLQRDEVVAEWIKAQGKMSLHVHCHISGAHWLLHVMAKLRFSIFCKDLPVVLEAFRHGDEAVFNIHPELKEALVWVYFHSNVKEYNRVECWGPLEEAAKGEAARELAGLENSKERPRRCSPPCDCCYPQTTRVLCTDY